MDEQMPPKDERPPQTPPSKGGEAMQAAPAAQTPPPAAPQMPMQTDAQANKWYGVLAYLGILCLIPLLGAKNSPFAQHHAKQGLVLFLAELILSILGSFTNSGIIGFGIFILDIIIFVLSIMGIIYAFQGTMWEMPVGGDLAKKIKL